MWRFLKKHRDRAVLGGILAICLLSMWISGRTYIAGPKEIGMSIVSTIEQVATSIGNFFSNTVTSIQKLVDLQKDYDALVKRVQTYESEQSSVQELRAENLNLRTVLGFTTSLNYPNLAAQVIGKAPGVFFTNFMVNKGFNDGLRKGMPVVAIQAGVQGLVGRVESVAPTSAQIQPIFSEDLFVAARLENSRYEGLIHGQGSSAAPVIMQYVDLQAQNQISIGEPVISAGINSDYPAGIHIGRVTGLNARPYENSIELEVAPIVTFSRLEYVFVLLKKPDEASL